MQEQATSAAVSGLRDAADEDLPRPWALHDLPAARRIGRDAEEPNEAPLSSVTDRLGNYRIERRDNGSLCELGRGAMGVTYRALTPHSNGRLR